MRTLALAAAMALIPGIGLSAQDGPAQRQPLTDEAIRELSEILAEIGTAVGSEDQNAGARSDSRGSLDASWVWSLVGFSPEELAAKISDVLNGIRRAEGIAGINVQDFSIGFPSGVTITFTLEQQDGP